MKKFGKAEGREWKADDGRRKAEKCGIKYAVRVPA
jgi:hypothetical protein